MKPFWLSPFPPPCFSGIPLALGSAATEWCCASWPGFSRGSGEGGRSDHSPLSPTQTLPVPGAVWAPRNALVECRRGSFAVWCFSVAYHQSSYPQDLFLLPEDTFHVPGLPYNKAPRLFLSVPVRGNTAGSGASPRRVLELPGGALSTGRSFRDGTRTPVHSQTRALSHDPHAY